MSCEIDVTNSGATGIVPVSLTSSGGGSDDVGQSWESMLPHDIMLRSIIVDFLVVITSEITIEVFAAADPLTPALTDPMIGSKTFPSATYPAGTNSFSMESEGIDILSGESYWFKLSVDSGDPADLVISDMPYSDGNALTVIDGAILDNKLDDLTFTIVLLGGIVSATNGGSLAGVYSAGSTPATITETQAGQSWLSGATGELCEISVTFSDVPTIPAKFEIDVHQQVGMEPASSDPLLGSVPFSIISAPMGDLEVPIDMTPAAIGVTGGVNYWFKVSTTTEDVFQIRGSTGGLDTYADGNLITCLDGVLSNDLDDDLDFTIKTKPSCVVDASNTGATGTIQVTGPGAGPITTTDVGQSWEIETVDGKGVGLDSITVYFMDPSFNADMTVYVYGPIMGLPSDGDIGSEIGSVNFPTVAPMGSGAVAHTFDMTSIMGSFATGSTYWFRIQRNTEDGNDANLVITTGGSDEYAPGNAVTVVGTSLTNLTTPPQDLHFAISVLQGGMPVADAENTSGTTTEILVGAETAVVPEEEAGQSWLSGATGQLCEICTTFVDPPVSTGNFTMTVHEQVGANPAESDPTVGVPVTFIGQSLGATGDNVVVFDMLPSGIDVLGGESYWFKLSTTTSNSFDLRISDGATGNYADGSAVRCTGGVFENLLTQDMDFEIKLLETDCLTDVSNFGGTGTAEIINPDISLPGSEAGQSWISGQSGQLCEICLVFFDVEEDLTADLTIEVHSQGGSDPADSDPIVGSAVVFTDKAITTDGVTTFDMTPGVITVSAGSKYWFKVSSQDTMNIFQIVSSSTNPYADGNAIGCTGTNFFNLPSDDLDFCIKVQSTGEITPPESTCDPDATYTGATGTITLDMSSEVGQSWTAGVQGRLCDISVDFVDVPVLLGDFTIVVHDQVGAMPAASDPVLGTVVFTDQLLGNVSGDVTVAFVMTSEEIDIVSGEKYWFKLSTQSAETFELRLSDNGGVGYVGNAVECTPSFANLSEDMNFTIGMIETVDPPASVCDPDASNAGGTGTVPLDLSSEIGQSWLAGVDGRLCDVSVVFAGPDGAAGDFMVSVYEQVGAMPAGTDTLLGTESFTGQVLGGPTNSQETIVFGMTGAEIDIVQGSSYWFKISTTSNTLFELVASAGSGGVYADGNAIECAPTFANLTTDLDFTIGMIETTDPPASTCDPDVSNLSGTMDVSVLSSSPDVIEWGQSWIAGVSGLLCDISVIFAGPEAISSDFVVTVYEQSGAMPSDSDTVIGTKTFLSHPLGGPTNSDRTIVFDMLDQSINLTTGSEYWFKLTSSSTSTDFEIRNSSSSTYADGNAVTCFNGVFSNVVSRDLDFVIGMVEIVLPCVTDVSNSGGTSTIEISGPFASNVVAGQSWVAGVSGYLCELCVVFRDPSMASDDFEIKVYEQLGSDPADTDTEIGTINILGQDIGGPTIGDVTVTFDMSSELIPIAKGTSYWFSVGPKAGSSHDLVISSGGGGYADGNAVKFEMGMFENLTEDLDFAIKMILEPCQPDAINSGETGCIDLTGVGLAFTDGGQSWEATGDGTLKEIKVSPFSSSSSPADLTVSVYSQDGVAAGTDTLLGTKNFNLSTAGSITFDMESVGIGLTGGDDYWFRIRRTDGGTLSFFGSGTPPPNGAYSFGNALTVDDSDVVTNTTKDLNFTIERTNGTDATNTESSPEETIEISSTNDPTKGTDIGQSWLAGVTGRLCDVSMVFVDSTVDTVDFTVKIYKQLGSEPADTDTLLGSRSFIGHTVGMGTNTVVFDMSPELISVVSGMSYWFKVEVDSLEEFKLQASEGGVGGYADGNVVTCTEGVFSNLLGDDLDFTVGVNEIPESCELDVNVLGATGDTISIIESGGAGAGQSWIPTITGQLCELIVVFTDGATGSTAHAMSFDLSVFEQAGVMPDETDSQVGSTVSTGALWIDVTSGSKQIGFDMTSGGINLSSGLTYWFSLTRTDPTSQDIAISKSSIPVYGGGNSLIISSVINEPSSDLIFATGMSEQTGMIGDPYIRAITGPGYHLPHDNGMYCLFDNLDQDDRLVMNVKCYVRKNNKSYARYFYLNYLDQEYVFHMSSLKLMERNKKFNGLVRRTKLKADLNQTIDSPYIEQLGWSRKVRALELHTQKYGVFKIYIKKNKFSVIVKGNMRQFIGQATGCLMNQDLVQTIPTLDYCKWVQEIVLPQTVWNLIKEFSQTKK